MTALELKQAITSFQEECEEAQYTDTDQAHELLRWTVAFLDEHADLLAEPAAVYLTHHGVTIYRVWRNDNPDAGPREYWYGLAEDCRDDGHASFDVRDLAIPGHSYDVNTDEGRRAAIVAAIEAGLLSNEGYE